MGLLLRVLLSVVIFQHAIVGTSSSTLESLIVQAFERSVRVLYLIALETRPVFEQLLRMPYLKVVFEGDRSIGTLDESCLVVLYVDVAFVDPPLDSFLQTFSGVGDMPWNARVLVLVENRFFEHVGILRMLQSWFWNVGIPYWSVAAMHHPTYLKYFLEHAIQTILVNAPLDFDTVYTYRRMKNERRVKVVYHYLNSVPYTFLNARNRIDGIDFVLFGLSFEYLNLDAKLVLIRKRTESATKDMLVHVIQNLLDQSIDFMMTRRVVDIKFLPMFVVPEPITFCLVVPRKRNLQLFSSLIQPFTNELWISLACGVAAAYSVKLLSQTETKLGSLMKSFLNGPLMGSIIDISLNVLSFVLIESYLAQITSLLLVHQYRRDPQTLEEFFATDIPIQMMESHNDFILSLHPNVSKAIMQRAVVMTTKMELLSEQYAYLDSVGRAAYSMTVIRKVDPITGLRASFILQQPLTSRPTAYLFARNAAPLRDYFALHLEWMRAFGNMHLVDGLFSYVNDVDELSFLGGGDLIRVEHMLPVFIFIACGWCVSGAVFFGERMVKVIGKK